VIVIEARTRLQAESYGDYIRRLINDLDLTHVGQGAFGHVIQHPTFTNVVVKIFRKDRHYMAFVRECEKQPHNPWLPKIAGISKLQLEGSSGAHAVFLEKLRPISSAELSRFKTGLVSEYGLRYDPRDPNRKWFDLPSWGRLSKQEAGGLEDFANLATSNYQRLDLHVGNIMKRGSQIVISDPFS
jgi:hypothetical protein